MDKKMFKKRSNTVSRSNTKSSTMSRTRSKTESKTRSKTRTGKKSGTLSVWSKKGFDPNSIVVQDIPEPPEYQDLLDLLAEQAIGNRTEQGLEKLKSSADEKLMVSFDTMEKYEIVTDFIRRKGLKIYGGVAINFYLPDEEKFYNEKEVPDYDFFSPDPWNDAIELADIFYAKGYKYVEAKAGIHMGTYKVFVNFWPVADISYMPQKEFDRIETTVKDGLQIVSKYKLLESLQKEFSEPYSNPSRWPKVAHREKLLSKWTKPLSEKLECSEHLFFTKKELKVDTKTELVNNKLKLELLNTIYKYCVRNDCIFMGATAYNAFMEEANAKYRIKTSNFIFLAENADKVTKEIITLLLRIYMHIDTTTEYVPAKELNNTIYTIYAIINNNHVRLCQIINLTSCTPFRKTDKIFICSLDYLKYEMYYEVVFGEKQSSEDHKCLLKYLNYVQKKYYEKTGKTELEDSLFQRFITNCKGPFYNNLKVEIYKRWHKKYEESKNTTHEYKDGYYIRKTPITNPKDSCEKNEKELCRYPCFWNKYIGKCREIVKASYEPIKAELYEKNE